MKQLVILFYIATIIGFFTTCGTNHAGTVAVIFLTAWQERNSPRLRHSRKWGMNFR